MDFGCGTGLLVSKIIDPDIFDEIVGVDVADGMIEVFQEKIKRKDFGEIKMAAKSIDLRLLLTLGCLKLYMICFYLNYNQKLLQVIDVALFDDILSSLSDCELSLVNFCQMKFNLQRYWDILPERIYNPIGAMGFSAMFTFQLDNTKR